MTDKLAYRLLTAIAVIMLMLCAVGAAALWRYDHATVALIELAQMPIYAIAAWLVVMCPSATTSSRRALIGILLAGLAMRTIIVPSPPASSDIYRYVWDGRVQGVGINPYRYVPTDPALASLRDEAIYPNMNRPEYAPTIYPPAAQLVFWAATRISETVTFLKFVVLGFEGLAVWAILQLLAARGLPSTRVLLYAWHPLPIWEFAGSGHVDAVAMAFLLLGLVAVDRRSPVLAGVALGAGTLVKYFPVVTAPAMYKRWDWRLPTTAALAIALLYLPYLGVGDKVFGFLGGYAAEEGLVQGQGLFLWQLLGSVLPLPDKAFPFYFVIAAMVMAALALGATFLRREPKADLPAAMTLTVVFLVLFSPHYSWYFAWLVPFVCVLPVAGLIYLTCAAAWLHFAPWPAGVGDGLVIYGGCGLILLGEFLARRSRRKEARHGHALPA